MQSTWTRQTWLKALRVQGCRVRAYSSKPTPQDLQRLETRRQLLKTRNIGIIAHIDAGKTTTTERMLYYSGFTRRIGDVDDGSTVTDFLPAERARGITIQSAAITFHWPPKPVTSLPSATKAVESAVEQPSDQHTINLIDTPGHADFTFEVIRSLRVLDGAVCILDGVAGVEAQTEKVWLQANKHRIPRMIYVNKLDRDGAAFNRTVHEIASRLHTWPVLCQIPWWEDGRFVGVGDVVGLRALLWEQGGDGMAVKASSLKEVSVSDPGFADEMRKARVALVEALTEHDESIVEEFLENGEDYLALSEESIKASLRRCLLHASQAITPVFAGASFRNIGVQPLLDAVNDFLPSPVEAPDAEISVEGSQSTLNALLNSDLSVSTSGIPNSKHKKPTTRHAATIANLNACALAFKVVTDPKRGVLVYVRVYSGSIARNALLYNTNLAISEKAPRLLRMYASDAVEIQSINEGEIGVIVGLKHARTGDTLIVYAGANPKTGPPEPLNSVQLRPIDVPPPVFFTSVEPMSLSEERNLTESLALLLREDPSLNITVDPESGQTHLAGMGELHLEISRDRLINDFKVKASTGPIEISYREAVSAASAPCTERFDREIAGKHAEAACTASVLPVEPNDIASDTDFEFETSTLFHLPDSNILIINHPTHSSTTQRPTASDITPLPSNLPLPVILSALRTGVLTALSRSPTHSFPVHSTRIEITFNPLTDLFPTTTASALASAARLATRNALLNAAASSPLHLLEPVMLATISVAESHLGAVVHDLNAARGAQVLSLDTEQDGSAAARFSDAQLKRVYAPPDPFGGSGGAVGTVEGTQVRQIRARVPLREMVGYLRHLRSLTGGRGTFVMSVEGFERVSGARRVRLLGELGNSYVS